MERISDIKDIASLLREVESGGATGKALQKLALFPDIRRKRRKPFQSKVDNRKKKRPLPASETKERQKYSINGGSSSSPKFIRLPTTVQSKKRGGTNHLEVFGVEASSKVASPQGLYEDTPTVSGWNDGASDDALSMLEANSIRNNKAETWKTEVNERGIRSDAATREVQQKCARDFFHKILKVDVNGIGVPSESLYGVLQAQRRAIKRKIRPGYILPESRRPVDRLLENKVLSNLIPSTVTDIGSPEQESQNVDNALNSERTYSTNTRYLKGAADQLGMYSATSADLKHLSKQKLNLEDCIDGASFYYQREHMKKTSLDDVHTFHGSSDMNKAHAGPTEFDFFSAIKDTSVLEKLAGQYNLVNELDHRQKQERAEKNALDRRLVDKIDKLKNSFPMEFLFEVGLKGVYENKVRDKMRSIITGWAYGLESQAILLWKRYVKHHRHQERIYASINIQRVWRGHAGRKLFSKCWWLREKDRENLRFKAFMLERLRWLSAITIQKHYRGWRGRCEFELHKQLIESIIVVQRVWRAKQARVLTLMLRHYESQKNSASTTIQKCYRGHLGRKKAKRQRHLIRREEHERLLESKEYILIYNFKKEGATRTLQRWWRNSANSRMKFQGHRIATDIQRVYRGYCARLIFKRKRFEKLQREEEKEYARIAIKLQAIYRGKQAKAQTRKILIDKINHKQELYEKKQKYLQRKQSKSIGTALARRISFKPKASKGKEREAAIRIQCAYRIKRAKRRVKKLKYLKSQWNRHKTDMCAKEIQRVYRGFAGRKRAIAYRRHKYAAVIQARFRGNRDREMIRNRMRYDLAIPTIQRYTRGFLARQLVKKMRFERENLIVSATKCQALIRQYFARRCIERQREFVHARFETKIFVTQRFNEAMIYECDRMILRLGFPPSKTALKILEREVAEPGVSTSAEAHRLCKPLEDLFLHYCKPAASMESMKFLNAIKQMNNLVESKKKKGKAKRLKTGGQQINAMEVDLSFAKAIGNAKKKQEEEMSKRSLQRGVQKKTVVKGISFQGFCDALSMLADIRYAIRNSKGTVTGYHVEAYRFHVRQRARFFKLVDEHVLAGTSNKLPGVKYKKKLDKYLRKRAEWAANRIQRCVRGYWGRTLFAITKRNYHIFKANQIKSVKIARLQRRWRKRQARRLLIQKYRTIVKKYIEPVSKRPYWHNPNCNSIRWKKIKWLRRGVDVRTVIELPDPDIEFVKLCDQCNDLTVSFYCVDCDDFYCESCYDSFHRKGKRKGHSKFSIECCVECEYQIGTRECHQCGDYYCDTCYWKAHSTGALVQHTFDALIPLCQSCGKQERANAVRVDCGGEQMCKVCYNTWWYPQGYDCFTLSLETRSMRRYRDKVLQEKEAARELEEKKKREKREERWRVIEAVKKIQGLYRMKKARRLWYPVILNAHEARIAKERREGKMKKVQGSMRYKMLSFLGVGDVLESDSHDVRVKKLIPMQLYESELRAKYDWLTEEDIEAAKFVGEKLTGLRKTQADALRTATLLKSAVNGENAELIKQKSLEAARATAKLTNKLAAKALGVEEGKIAEAAVRNAKKAKENAKKALKERRRELNSSIGEGLKDFSKQLRLAGVGGRFADFLDSTGAAARKKARKIERDQIRQIKFEKRLKLKMQERADIRARDAIWELIPDDGYGTGEYWYNNETGESSYEDPRTFGDDPDDMDEINEEVEEEMTEDESSDESSEGEGSNDLRKNGSDNEDAEKQESKWNIEYDDENKPYYYNIEGVVTYTKPEDYDGPDDYKKMEDSYGDTSDWQEAYDDDGNVYYYNSAGVSTYDYPW